MIRNSLIVFFILSFSVIAAEDDDICPNKAINMHASTPTKQFLIDNDAENIVVDNKTGLMWTRCPVGYNWVSNNCSKKDAAFVKKNWIAALFFVDDNVTSDDPYLDYNDWRMPNIKELASIVERKCTKFAINHVIFGSAGVGKYWSSTHVMGDENVRYIDFSSGLLKSSNPTSNEYFFRLVRDVTP